MSVALFPLREALTILGQILSALITADKEDHNNASVILSFCKHCGEDYAGKIFNTTAKLSYSIRSLQYGALTIIY